MGLFLRHATTRRTLALIVAAALSAGCTSWRPAPGDRGALIASAPDAVRVQPLVGQAVVLYEPSLVGEELVGFRLAGDSASRLAIPMRDVRFVEVRRFDAGRTFATAAIVVTAFVFFRWADRELGPPSHCSNFLCM